ncbi:MAG: Hsp33 family molecular chaperone HslO [Hahellaceae bacterium]|nr:Hsp33 family molecular chaperone HslO [Hahellaceae bacterium]MCP5169306.1 Hsp33 family molecular chaperone HslO [Hahellaceae bacterium]
MSNHDLFQRFLFEDFQIRGEIVRLNQSYLEVLNRKDYPEMLARLLGEALVATTLLSGTLKFEGILAVQARAKGPVTLLMTECTHERQIRGIAEWEGVIPEEDLAMQLREGMLAITIDPEKGSRYQGIVPLERRSLAHCLEHYFELSEQLDTFILIHVSDQSAAGMLLQKLPAHNPEHDADAWNRITSLAASLKAEELHQLENEEILYRLFNEERVTLYPSEAVKFHCSCTRARTENAIRAMGAAEVYELLSEKSPIEVDCQFCGQHYCFDRTDIEHLFGKNILH